MEKGPEFRIIGNVSEEKKEEVKENLRGRLFEKHLEEIPPNKRERIEKGEIPKSEKEKALIMRANDETNRLMEEAGIAPYDIPERNFHIVPADLFKEIDPDYQPENVATTLVLRQGSFFDADFFKENPAYFGSIAFHEMMHLKGNLTVEVQPKKDQEDSYTHSEYRGGIGVRALQQKGMHGKYYQHFQGLDEAIVSLQEKKYIEKLFTFPELEEERTWMSSPEVAAIKKSVSEKRGTPEGDIVWVTKDGKEADGLAYAKQREILGYIAEEIQKEYPEKYSSDDDVMKEFLKAHFSGHLLTIGKLVDKTFGEGSFRILGVMENSGQSAIKMYEVFRRARLRALKKKNK